VFLPYYVNQLNAYMNDGSGFQVTPVAVPEPASLLLLAPVAAAAAWRVRRRRARA